MTDAVIFVFPEVRRGDCRMFQKGLKNRWRKYRKRRFFAVTGGAMKILVVDDDNFNLRVAQDIILANVTNDGGV